MVSPAPRSRGMNAAFSSILAALALGAANADAHEAPSSWMSPKACCSDMDCRAVPRDAVSERPEGYVIDLTGEVLPYSDGRLREAPDGEYHSCSTGGSDSGHTICLFVPPHSF